MLTCLIAYLVLWLAVLGYVLRLAARQRRLQQAVAALRQQSRRSQKEN
jgi:CcmD family protein